MQEVRVRVEHIHVIRLDRPRRLYLSVLQKAHKKIEDRRRACRVSGKIDSITDAILAVQVTITTYICLGIPAYLERGYLAYGGEVIGGVAAGILTWKLLRWLRR